MLTLNLASANLKKEIQLRHLYLLIKKLNYLLIIFAAIIATVLLAARVILQNNFNEIVAETVKLTKNNTGYNAKIRDINNKLDYINNIQENYVTWTNLLENLAKITPDGVKFSYLNISQDDKLIKIKGHADTRDTLLNFKNRLENTDFYANIDFPMKNILEKKNIDFDIKANLNISKISIIK